MIKVKQILTAHTGNQTAALKTKFGVPAQILELEDFKEINDALIDRQKHLAEAEKSRSKAIIAAHRFARLDREFRPHAETLQILDVDPRYEPYAGEVALINSSLDIQALYESRAVWGSAHMSLDFVCRIMCMVEFQWQLGWPRRGLGANWASYRGYNAFGAQLVHGASAVMQEQPPGEEIQGVLDTPVASLGYTTRFVQYDKLYMLCNDIKFLTPILEFEVPEWWVPGDMPAFSPRSVRRRSDKASDTNYEDE